MCDPGWTQIELGLGLNICYRFTSASEIDFQLCFQSTELANGTINEANPELKLQVGEDDLVRADLDVTLQPVLGQVLASGDVALNEGGTWTPVVQFQNEVLFLFDPTSGSFGGNTVPQAPAVPANPGQWVASYCSSGSRVTRFHVTDDERVLTDIGYQVKQRMWPGYPPFVLNIIACCGERNADGSGPYVDPTQPWFNVFLGAYQVDCLKGDGWTRPFGYDSANGKDSAIHSEDIERVGKSDWNWFSNFMYGVPAQVCAQYSNIGDATFDFLGTQQIGSSLWHSVTLSNVTVASAYQSNAPGAQQLVENSMLTPNWQKSFGTPCPRDGFPTSFIPTTLNSALFMAYSEDADGYHTVMIGGTTNPKFANSQPFLAAQMNAVKQALATSYPAAGFPTS